MRRGRLIEVVREAASFLGGSRADFDPLIDLAHRAHFVLLGEATHGSHELYRERARLSQRLVTELGFNAVVAEADWPDADRANRWAQGRSDDGDAADSLSGFRRFPPGCGATPWWSISSAGCARTTSSRAARRCSSTAWTSTPCTARWP